MAELKPRVAAPASPTWNLTKTWIQTAGMWFVFLFFLPIAVYLVEGLSGLADWRFPSAGAQAIGQIAFAGGGALGIYLGMMFATRGEGTPLPFDTARKFIVHGPYRHVRNPMAISSFVQGFGVALWLGSPAVALYVLAGMAVWQRIARPWEERDLLARFGEPYRRYRDAVPCWRFRLRPYRDEKPARAPPPSPGPHDGR